MALHIDPFESGMVYDGENERLASALKPEEGHALVLLLLAGENGLTQTKGLKAIPTDVQLALELSSYAAWERDLRGRPVYFTLTWRGQEVAEAALRLGRRAARQFAAQAVATAAATPIAEA